jgi:hypothetical protein
MSSTASLKMDVQMESMMRFRSGVIAYALALVVCGSQCGSALAGDHKGAMASVPSGGSDAPANEVVAPNKTTLTVAYTQDRSNLTSAEVLKDIFVHAGTIDGKPIKDFQLRSRCQTAFVTADSTIVIDWSHVGNYAGRSDGSRESFAIDDGKGSHTIAVPAGEHPEPLGNAGARVDGGMGVIADSCSK